MSSSQLDVAHALCSEYVEIKVAASRHRVLKAHRTSSLETGVFNLSFYIKVCWNLLGSLFWDTYSQCSPSLLHQDTEKSTSACSTAWWPCLTLWPPPEAAGWPVLEAALDRCYEAPVWEVSSCLRGEGMGGKNTLGQFFNSCVGFLLASGCNSSLWPWLLLSLTWLELWLRGCLLFWANIAINVNRDTWPRSS